MPSPEPCSEALHDLLGDARIEQGFAARDRIDSVCERAPAGLLQHVLAPPADHHVGAELEISMRHRAAQTAAAAGDQDAFALEQVGLEHGYFRISVKATPAASRPSISAAL